MNVSRRYLTLKPRRKQEQAEAPAKKESQQEAPVRLAEEDQVFLDAAKWAARHTGGACLD